MKKSNKGQKNTGQQITLLKKLISHKNSKVMRKERERLEKYSKIQSNLSGFFKKPVPLENAMKISPYLFTAVQEKTLPVPKYWKYKTPNTKCNKNSPVEYLIDIFTGEKKEFYIKSDIFYQGNMKFFEKQVTKGIISSNLYMALNGNLQIFKEEENECKFETELIKKYNLDQ
ncbi:hypothetical protein NUSPORA_02236 [Nucleospora cyclopteri]